MRAFREPYLIDLSYDDVKRELLKCDVPRDNFLATIRNANDVFMKFIGSPTTCTVNRY
jgi:hypothetical protein